VFHPGGAQRTRAVRERQRWIVISGVKMLQGALIMEHMTAAQPNAGLYIQRFSADDAAICRMNNGLRTAGGCAETFG